MGSLYKYLRCNKKLTIEQQLLKRGKMNNKICPSCGFGIKPDDKFCGNCGAPLLTADNIVSKEVDTSNLKARIRTFHNKASKLEEVLKAVRNILEKENLEVQTIKDSYTIILQARKKTSNNKYFKITQKIYRSALGLEMAISVCFEKIEEDLNIKIGVTKWLDKAIGGAVFWFVTWPAIIFTGWGIYKQQSLIKEIDDECIRLLS